MKLSILFFCALLYGLFVTFLSAAGIQLGGLPTILLAGVILYAGRYLSQKLYKDDEENGDEEEEKEEPEESAEPEADSVPPAPVPPSPVSSSPDTPPMPSVPEDLPSPTPVPAKKEIQDADGYRKKFRIAVSVSCILLVFFAILCVCLMLDISRLEESVSAYQQSVLQLEEELGSVKAALKETDFQYRHLKDTMDTRCIDAYNEGIYTGYITGYDVAAKQKGKAKPIDELGYWERETMILVDIGNLYRTNSQ